MRRLALKRLERPLARRSSVSSPGLALAAPAMLYACPPSCYRFVLMEVACRFMSLSGSSCKG